MTTRDDLRLLAQEAADRAADRAVSDCLLKLGINAEDNDAVIKFQSDLSDLRAMAALFRDMKSKGALAAWIFVLTAVMGAVWIGIKASLH